MLQEFLKNIWCVAIDAAPWLLLGLLAAGLIKAYVPEHVLGRWLGGRGSGSVVRAALIGAPLPLCSCGVLPAAFGLHRQGASKGATVSFLVATPETGVDSIAVSYALLGPFMAVVRPVAAVFSAIAAGLLSNALPQGLQYNNVNTRKHVNGSPCLGDKDGCKTRSSMPSHATMWSRLSFAWRYAMSELLDDLSAWLAIGLLLAGAVSTFVTPDSMTTWGSGLAAMLAMLAVGIPIYICATASTPLAAAMLQAGISPGTVLVFLLAGPATNMATLGLLLRELGGSVLVVYLSTICVSAIAFGLLTDLLVAGVGIDISAQVSQSREVIPVGLATISLVLLISFALRPLRRYVLGW